MSDYDFDAIVVGSGLGGLSAAATLAKNGLRVHVIEPHDKVGGFATNFRRGAYRMETGIHMLPGVNSYSQSQQVLDFLEINKNIQFVEIPDFYHCHFSGEVVRMPHMLEQAKLELSQRFPHEQHAIEQYFSTMLTITRDFAEFSIRKPFISATHPMFKVLFPRFEKYWHMSVGAYFDRLFADPVLKAVLLANVGFYHSDHYDLSLVIFMISQCGYHLGGCYYIQGGSQILSNYLRKIIENADGKISLFHQVQSLNIVSDNRGQRVGSVFYQKVTGENPELKESKAPLVVINAPAPLAQKWLGRHNRTDEFGLSTSATTVYLGLKKSLCDFGNNQYLNIFIDQEQPSTESHLALLNYDSIPSGLSQSGAYNCEAMFMDQQSAWQGLSPMQYQERKLQIKNRVLARIEKQYPGFVENVEVCEVGTPQTVIRYTGSPAGAIYGYNPSPESFRLRSDSLSLYSGARDPQYSNLYYASAWSYMPGFSGVLIAGYKAAQEALGAGF